ncbi:MAG TPA: alpha/beta hydrolase [Blastocatellia bacterium]|jgi:proline iminopeptidase
MKHLLRICFVCSMILGLAPLTRAQDGSTRAEFDCLRMSSTSGAAVAGKPEPFVSYHHVWTPGLTYGSFKSKGLNLTYETQGTGDEVVIVVHGGAGLPHEYFHPVLSNLSPYAKMVYFDRRADMLSSGSPQQNASLEEMADDIEALRQALGVDHVTLFGHSFGAAIALNYALRHPAGVNRLILISASAVIESPYESEKRILKTLTPAEMTIYSSNEGGKGAASPCDRVRRRYGVLYRHYFHKLIPYEFDRGVYTAYFDALAKKQALASDDRGVDVEAQLSEIRVPVLIIAGKHDLVTPPDQSSELAKGLSQSRLVVMEHSAHFPFFEENYLFTQWVRQFMASTPKSPDERMSHAATMGATGAAR